MTHELDAVLALSCYEASIYYTTCTIYTFAEGPAIGQSVGLPRLLYEPTALASAQAVEICHARLDSRRPECS